MRIASFGIYGYRGRQDWEWNECFAYPSWPEIEAAIRKLDANEYAGVGFALEGVYEDGGEQPSLHITGGQGQYSCLVFWRWRSERSLRRSEQRW
jgi:hypothetical protein